MKKPTKEFKRIEASLSTSGVQMKQSESDICQKPDAGVLFKSNEQRHLEVWPVLCAVWFSIASMACFMMILDLKVGGRPCVLSLTIAQN